MADFKASHRHAPITARKARLVADLVRGLPVNHALVVLDRAPQRAAYMFGKVVRSAVANAESQAEIDPNHLRVSEVRVDEGPLKGGHVRWRPAARGRAMPYRKRTAHLHVKLSTQPDPAGTGPAAEAASQASTGRKAAASESKEG